MQQSDDYIITNINGARTSNLSNFSMLVRFSDEHAKSKAMLIERVNYITQTLLPAHGATCWSQKIYYAFVTKEKSTYFHAILYCKFNK